MDYYNGLAPDDKLDVFEKLWVATSDTEKKIIYKGIITSFEQQSWFCLMSSLAVLKAQMQLGAQNLFEAHLV